MSAPNLPASWAEMTATERNRWLHGVAGLTGIDWKRRTRKFHVWTFSETLACSVSTAGLRTLDEAIELRAKLVEIVGGTR